MTCSPSLYVNWSMLQRLLYDYIKHLWWSFLLQNISIIFVCEGHLYASVFVRGEINQIKKNSKNYFYSYISLSFALLSHQKHLWLSRRLVLVRARLHETRSELKPVWDFTWDKISLWCEVTSLAAFTWLQVVWNSLRCKFHFGQIDRSEISNRSEFST